MSARAVGDEATAPLVAPVIHPAIGHARTEVLLRPINARRVFQQDGQSHLAAWDVRAHLSRVFGFGEWDAETVDLHLIHDIETTTKAGKPARKVAYRAHVRLRIHATGAVYSGWAVGENTMPEFKQGDGHDFAIKTAESQALKRCATNLGSQFGLSLYDGGNRLDVVKGVIGFSREVAEPEVSGDDTVPESVEDEPTIEPTRPVERQVGPTPADHPDPWATVDNLSNHAAHDAPALDATREAMNLPPRDRSKPSAKQVQLVAIRISEALKAGGVAVTTEARCVLVSEWLQRPYIGTLNDLAVVEVRRFLDADADLSGLVTTLCARGFLTAASVPDPPEYSTPDPEGDES